MFREGGATWSSLFPTIYPARPCALAAHQLVSRTLVEEQEDDSSLNCHRANVSLTSEDKHDHLLGGTVK